MGKDTSNAAETNLAHEGRKWHLSWIIASLVAVVVGAILAWSGLDMIPSILIVAIGWVLTIALLWLMTPARLHTLLKGSASLILLICAWLSVQWIYRVDRPIIFPEIGGLITQNYRGSALSVDLEALVKNAGRQSGYADSWRLDLTIDGTTIQGRELFGEPLPEHAANEPPMFDQEFPPGKPVRGWLFFAFPTVSHDYAAPYFTCGSPLMDKVSLRLLVWDSKMKHEWSKVRSLKDMGAEACTPLAVVLPVQSFIPPHDHNAQSQVIALKAISLPPDAADKSTPGAIHPGIMLVITARSMIQRLQFVAKCDVPCFFSRGEFPSGNFENRFVPQYGDVRIATVQVLAPTELQKGQQLILNFRSMTDTPLSVLSINGEPVPGAKNQPPATPLDSIWKVVAACPPGSSVNVLNNSVFDGGKGVGITTAKDACLIVDGRSYVRGDAGAVCLGCGKDPNAAKAPNPQ